MSQITRRPYLRPQNVATLTTVKSDTQSLLPGTTRKRQLVSVVARTNNNRKSNICVASSR